MENSLISCDFSICPCGPLVSILIPVYNVEAYIERCARSAFEQSYQNLEFIFVDDATPDASIQVLQRVIADYPDRCDSIKILHHERNRGLAAARNTAIAACHGDFVMHVDSDDWLEPEAAELLICLTWGLPPCELPGSARATMLTPFRVPTMPLAHSY